MSNKKEEIVKLLEAYPYKKRKIEQLRFELEHPSLIGEKELIDSLALGVRPPGEGGVQSRHISNKIMTIALQYQNIMQRMNNETISDIVNELRSLESEVARLELYISLLDKSKADVIRMLYIEKKTWAEAESDLHVSKRTLLKHRKDALNELESMYSYIDNVKGKTAENAR